MKKITYWSGSEKFPGLKKLFRIMKLTTFLILISIGCVFASKTYSQTKTLNLKLDNTTVKEVLSEIEDQSEFYFMYNGKLIDAEREVSVNIKKQKVEEVLNSLFASTDVTYVIKDRFIVLTTEGDESDVSSVLQQKSISGTVTDESGGPLPGVTIIIKGTTNGTVTNMDGNYTLSNVPADATLVFSFVGMLTQEIEVGNQTTIDISMELDAIGIEEVVAVGYGVKKKVNLTSAVATVNLDALETRPVTNLSQALVGTTTGVTVLEGSSQPGRESSQVLIRGFNTINNASPLVLIDGIVGSMGDVSSNDVAEMTVLKDPSSAAIYGARAANGVILITTKRGKVGETRVSYRGYYGIQNATMLPEITSNSVDYMRVANTYKVNGGQPVFYSEETINTWKNATDRVMYPNTDWLDLTLGNSAEMHSHNFGVSGGTEKARFNISLNYLDQDGVVEFTNNKKYDFRANFDSKVSDKFSFGLNLAGGRQDRLEPGSVGSVITWATSTNPMVIPKLDGKYGGPQTLDDGDLGNALKDIETKRNTLEAYRFVGKLFAKYNFTKELSFEVNAAAKYGHNMTSSYQKTWELYNFHTNPDVPVTVSVPMVLTDNQNRSFTKTLYSLLQYRKTFFDTHSLDLMVGYSEEEYRYDFLQGSISDFPNNSLFELNAGMNEISMKALGAANENSLRSYFGRFSYDYKGKYLLDGNFRYDGSSKFADENRWGFFPGVSAAWRISEEDFMKDFTSLDNLKLRASYASVGNNQVGNYPYISTYTIGTNYSFGNQFFPGMAITNLVNPDLKWETTVSTDIGLDATFLNGKIDLSVDYFNKETRDMIEAVSIPVMTGMGNSKPSRNIGNMSNKGFELGINHKNNINKLKYYVGVTLSSFQNELVKYNESVDDISGGFILREGETVHSLYGYESEGIFQSPEEVTDHAFQNNFTAPGDLIYKDQITEDTDGDGIADATDGVIDGNDRVILGSPLPKFTYGINLGLEYRNFDLSAIFSGSHGAKGYLRGAMMSPLVYPDRGMFITDWLDHWAPDNTDTDIPAPSQYNLYSAQSSYWMHDLSYLKLKNVKLGYTVPAKLSGKLKIRELHLFVNAQNVFVLTKFPHVDPERGLKQTGISYPVHRTISFGVDINF
jgi:TonB-dependent starch-binding outer membrane protein SusC